MSKWYVGFNKAGEAPELEPLEVHSFQYGRELLLAMLTEASECALEAGEDFEAATLKTAFADVFETVSEQEFEFTINQHIYWLSRDAHGLLASSADAMPVDRFEADGRMALLSAEG